MESMTLNVDCVLIAVLEKLSGVTEVGGKMTARGSSPDIRCRPKAGVKGQMLQIRDYVDVEYKLPTLEITIQKEEDLCRSLVVGLEEVKAVSFPYR